MTPSAPEIAAPQASESSHPTAQGCARRLSAPPRTRKRVAYIMSRFPKLTETFILYEMLAVERQGVDVEVFPLARERTKFIHPEAAALVARAHFRPLVSLKILWAHLYFLSRNPSAYFGALGTLLWANLGSLRYFGGAVLYFPKIVRFAYEVSALGVDHVHAHFASHPAAAAFVIHRLTGIPYSFTAHGSDLHRDRHMLREKVAEAAFVATISDYNRQLILEHCGSKYAEQVCIVHCGVDPDFFTASPSAVASRGTPRVLCIGTLHEVKGQTYLIEAARLLADRGMLVECQFIGDGPDLAALTAQAEKASLPCRAIFHGRKTRDEVKQLLGEADIVVAPSVPTSDGRREGIPVVLIEAMAAGVPVVASRLSGIPELVEHEHTGLLAPPRDAQALANEISRLVENMPLRRRLAAAGRDRVMRQFNLEQSASTLSDWFGGSR